MQYYAVANPKAENSVYNSALKQKILPPEKTGKEQGPLYAMKDYR